ncbi:hypothetical protein Tco_0522488 [Tanacetum coccineum]
MEGVGLPRTTGTSRLNSCDGRFRKEKPTSDSIDPDRLFESQTVIVTEVTITEATGPDQRGSTRVDFVLITPDETPTLEATPRGNPELTSCTLGASKHPSDVLAQNLNLHVHPITDADDPIPSPHITTIIITKPTGSKQKKHLHRIVTKVRRFNPLSKQFKALCEKVDEQQRKIDEFVTHKVLAAVQEDPLGNREGEKRYKKLRFTGHSYSRNDKVMLDARDHDKQPSFVRKTREHPRWFVGPPTKYIDYLWVTRSDAEERFNEVAIEQGLKIDNKEPLPLIGPKLSRRIPLEHLFNEDLKILMTRNKDLKERKYAFSVNKHYAAEYKCGWIEEDIGKLFMKTLVNYDMDVMLGIHHWEKMRRLAYRGKRSDTSPGKESDFIQLNLNDIEDMYVLKAQGKLKQHKGDTKYYLVQSLLVYMRSLIIIKRVKDVQLVYEDWDETKKFIRGDEVFKICDGTLTEVKDQLANMLRMN